MKPAKDISQANPEINPEKIDNSHLHHHHHLHSAHTENADGDRSIAVAFWLNFLFSLIEIAGAYFTNSIAILADAIHDLGDSVSIALVYGLEKFSRKKSTATQTFGFRRYSLLGAFVSSLVLISGSVWVVYNAVIRIMAPEPVHAEGMVALAVLGIAVNGVAVLRIKNGNKMSQKVIYLHLLEDVLGWAAVLVVSIVLLFVNLPILDPILSLAIATFILTKIYPNLKGILRIFLQHTPEDQDANHLRKHLLSWPEIQDVHDLHLWTLDGQYHILSAHIVVPEEMPFANQSELKERIRKFLQDHGVSHATLEMEPDGNDCPDCGL